MQHKEKTVDVFSVILPISGKNIYKTVGIVSCTQRTIILEFQMNEADFQAWQPAICGIFATIEEE